MQTPVMRHNNFRRPPRPTGMTPSPEVSVVATAMGVDGFDFSPSPDEVARRAYFAYENEGSRPGRDVQHWLEAEAQLLAERNQRRVHDCHNRT